MARFDAAVGDDGAPTFHWAFTTDSGIIAKGDQVLVARVDDSGRDMVVVRRRSGSTAFYEPEHGGGGLRPLLGVQSGQLPTLSDGKGVVPALVRPPTLRYEPGSAREDLLAFDPATRKCTNAHARAPGDDGEFTWSWSWTSHQLTSISGPANRPFGVIVSSFSDEGQQIGSGGPLKDAAGDPLGFFQSLFGAAGPVTRFWFDASFGNVDIGDTEIFGWIELQLARINANSLNRTELVDRAIGDARRAGINLSGFSGFIGVFTHNFSRNTLPGTNQTPGSGTPWVDEDNPWTPFWIDGSAAGNKISAPPPGHYGEFVCHEIGHVLGLSHDRRRDPTASEGFEDYGDTHCAMSSTDPNTPGWRDSSTGTTFGPGLCLPHLLQAGWLSEDRVIRRTDWTLDRAIVTLAPVADRTAFAASGAVLAKLDNPALALLHLLHQGLGLESRCKLRQGDRAPRSRWPPLVAG